MKGASKAEPIVYPLEDVGAATWPIVVTRCTEQEEAVQHAIAEAQQWDGGDWYVHDVTPGRYRMNPCTHRGEHHHDIAAADRPGRGNSPGFMIQLTQDKPRPVNA